MTDADQSKLKVSFYKKQNSFETTHSRLKSSPEREIERSLLLIDRALTVEGLDPARSDVLRRAREAIATPDGDATLRVSKFLADELMLLKDSEVTEFWFHRYRYEIFPIRKLLDQYPPYLQIEPSSVCNFRCVFCYQTDASFSSRSSGFMGRMLFDTFKKIVDMAEGNVQFLSLASRGEPTLCPDLPKMLEYTRGKFLNLKLNTNASMLTEPLCHAILTSGVRTVVFSADAAEEPAYSQFRVHGNLEKTLANISRFEKIRKEQYPGARVITRVSGVKVSESQELEKMINVWGELADQIAFVAYNPWENIYESKPNGQQRPCSDLWRRMFVWHDGSVNPCDSDYKSTLKMGNIFERSLSELWRSQRYEMLREGHSSGARQVIEPCKRCALV